ncbi:MAG: ABC transporter permease [Acidobacteria bacterium]|nr:ABC transporter permease [Acidobacteriota bacterium]
MGILRDAWRALGATPGVAALAVLSLALGIGANTAIFSVTSALLLEPLPYRDADRLVILWNRSPGLGIAEDWFSTAQYFDIRTSHQGLEDVAIAVGGNDNLTGDGGEPERIGTIRMSSNLLPLLGVEAARGRLFGPSDDVPGAAGAALISDGTWRRRYGADPAVVGRRLVINGQPYEIAGVLPAGFTLPREVLPTLYGAEDAEIVLPLPLGPDAPSVRTREDYNIVARLRPGVSVAEAQAEMDALTARLRRDYPAMYPPNGGLTFSVVPLQEQVVGDARRPVLLLMASVALVLLIACANVASLLLSRALARQREMAVRISLGASRRQVLAHVLAESLMLSAGGALLGLLLASLGLQWLRLLGTASVPRLREVAIDPGVLLFTTVVAVAAGLLFGIVPALRASRIDPHVHLMASGRGASGAGALWARGRNLRTVLVTLEVALAVMLLIGAGLLVRSFARVLAVPPGFNPSGTLTMEITMSGRRYSDTGTVLETYRRIWERLSLLPGVSAAGGVSALPLSQMFAWGPIQVEGRAPRAGEEFINVDMRFVGGDYFRAMQIPLVAGRLFTEFDTRETMRVALADERMAEDLWPGQDPIGKRVRTGGRDSETPWITIVGVVGRVKQYTLDGDSRIAMYFPQTQVPVRAMNLVLRSGTPPGALTAAVKSALAEIDPDLPIYRVRTMEERVAESVARRRFAMLLLALFAVVAVGLAAIGVYGVLAYLVSQGTRDLGIRMALGATRGAVLRLVVGGGMAVALTGVAIGLAGAAALAGLVESLLFGVAPLDPATFGAVASLVVIVAVVSSYVPARRAARIDPAICLRAE